MSNHKYAVIYHDILEGGMFWFELVHTCEDLKEACCEMFDHFDEQYCLGGMVDKDKKFCLMASQDMECEHGLIYFIVNLNDPPKSKADYAGLSRYYILHKEEKR